MVDLLHQLYGELIIPEAVWQEIVVAGAGQPGAEGVKAAAWIRMQAISNLSLAQALRQELGAGEAEAITLALEEGAELLLMDDGLGRETAGHLGLRCMGLIGVLVESKRKGLIGAVKPHLDALRDLAGFRLGDTILQRVLQDEGEG